MPELVEDNSELFPDECLVYQDIVLQKTLSSMRALSM